MENRQPGDLHYLTVGSQDERWGMVVTTVGYQFVPPGGSYPLSRHPDGYDFKPQSGRVLGEYQMVYITRGDGYFSSASSRRQKVSAGTMMLLFPDEWHDYRPNPSTGWDEYWVGFRGEAFDALFRGRFFTREEPLIHIGVSATVVGLYEDLLGFAQREKSGCQQMSSGIVLHILGAVYYKRKNQAFTNNTYVVDKINQARIMMKERCEGDLSCEEVARRLGLGYSWFRRMFRQYTGVPPAQYMLQQKILRAKELLSATDLNISEIAYRLHFENPGQFATSFRKKTGMTPSDFRRRAR